MADNAAEAAAGAATTQDAAADTSSTDDYTQDGAVAREIAAVMVSARRDLDAASPVARLLLCSYH